MSAATKLKNKQADNRAALKNKQAGVGLDDPQQRKDALAAIPARGGTTTSSDSPAHQATPADPATPKPPTPRAKRGSKPAATSSTNDTTGQTAQAMDPALFEALTERAKPGMAADTKIIAPLDPATRALLASTEKDVFRAARKRLSRSAVMTEAARRVAAAPSAYTEMAGTDFGARIPGDVYADLIEVTNLAEPKLAYGPRVGSAIAELLAELNSHTRTLARTPDRTHAQPDSVVVLD